MKVIRRASLKSRLKRLTLGTVVAVMCAETILIGLGVWQMERLAWKTKLLASLDAVAQADPLLAQQDFLTAERSGQLFLHGHVRGAFLNQDEFLIGPRTHDGAIGYHVYAPMRLQGGGTLLIDRGWIPLDQAGAGASRSIQGSATVTGLARHPDRPNSFTPANQPQAGEWYSVDFAALERTKNLPPLLPYVLYAQPSPAGRAGYPLPQAQDWRPPNNHLQYALTWFSMAVILLVVLTLS
jgi:surfeit locus 1 family protein